MPPVSSYNSTVAARTRAAEQILGDKELLSKYEDEGGLKEDLIEIRDHGLSAEARSGAQSGAQAAGGAATANVLESFAEVQREYVSIMAVLQASQRDLQKAEASNEVLAAVRHILVNEAEVAVRTEEGVDKEGKPTRKRTVTARATQEATRAEIVKDTVALIGLKPAHAVLAKRKVDIKRLTKLKEGAEALAGKLADRTVKKGAAKTATASEREAVTAQKEVWGGVYRILAKLGRKDQRVAALLKEAARKS